MRLLKSRWALKQSDPGTLKQFRAHQGRLGERRKRENTESTRAERLSKGVTKRFTKTAFREVQHFQYGYCHEDTRIQSKKRAAERQIVSLSF